MERNLGRLAPFGERLTNVPGHVGCTELTFIMFTVSSVTDSPESPVVYVLFRVSARRTYLITFLLM